MNRKIEPDYSYPAIFCEINQYGTMGFAIECPHITHLLKLTEFLGSYSSYQQGVSAKFKWKPFEKEDSQEYIQIYQEYRQSLGDDKTSSALAESLVMIEGGFQLKEILGHREAALLLQNLSAKIKLKQKEIEDVKKQLQEGYGSMLKGYVGFGKSKEQKQKESEEQDQKIQEAQKQVDDLQKQIKQINNNVQSYVQYEEKPVPSQYPENYVSMQLQVNFNKIKLSILESNSKPLIANCLRKLQLGYQARAKSMTVTMTIGSAYSKDYVAKSTVFPYLSNINKETMNQNQALTLKFETCPLNMPEADMLLEFKVLTSFDMFVNLESLLYIMNVTKKAMDVQVDLKQYSKAAEDKAVEYVQAGKSVVNEVVKGNFQRVGIYFDVEIDSPTVFIPLNINSLQERIFIIDIGRLIFKSDLRKWNKDTNYNLVNDEAQLYDVQKISLDEFAVFICPSLPNSNVQDFKTQERHMIVNESTFSLEMKNCLTPLHPVFPTAKIDSEIPSIFCTFSDHLLKFTFLYLHHLSELQEEMNKKFEIKKVSTVKNTQSEINTNMTAVELANASEELKKITKEQNIVNFQINFILKKLKWQLETNKKVIIDSETYNLKLNADTGRKGQMKVKLLLEKFYIQDQASQIQPAFSYFTSNPILIEKMQNQQEQQLPSITFNKQEEIVYTDQFFSAGEEDQEFQDQSTIEPKQNESQIAELNSSQQMKWKASQDEINQIYIKILMNTEKTIIKTAVNDIRVILNFTTITQLAQ